MVTILISPERRDKWFYRVVDADGNATGPVRDVRFPRPVELADAAEFAAETEHLRLFRRQERMHQIEDRAKAADGTSQTFEFSTMQGIKRMTVKCLVKFDYQVWEV